MELSEEIESKVIECAIRHHLIKHSSDLEITTARGFNGKAVSIAKLFEDKYIHIEDISNIQKIKIFRYFMGKAAETFIADELYADDEERVCEISYLLDEVDKEYFTINIPAHYIWILSDLSLNYLLPLKEFIQTASLEECDLHFFSTAVYYWQQVAYADAHIRKAHQTDCGYDNKKIKTLDEIRIVAIHGLSKLMITNGWTINKMNYLLSSPWSIIGSYKGEQYALLVRINYGFQKAVITINELKGLADYVKTIESSIGLGYVLVDIQSANQQHKKDKLIIIGDKMNFEIVDFQQFNKKTDTNETS